MSAQSPLHIRIRHNKCKIIKFFSNDCSNLIYLKLFYAPEAIILINDLLHIPVFLMTFTQELFVCSSSDCRLSGNLLQYKNDEFNVEGIN